MPTTFRRGTRHRFSSGLNLASILEPALLAYFRLRQLNNVRRVHIADIGVLRESGLQAAGSTVELLYGRTGRHGAGLGSGRAASVTFAVRRVDREFVFAASPRFLFTKRFGYVYCYSRKISYSYLICSFVLNYRGFCSVGHGSPYSAVSSDFGAAESDGGQLANGEVLVTAGFHGSTGHRVQQCGAYRQRSNDIPRRIVTKDESLCRYVLVPVEVRTTRENDYEWYRR